MILRRTGMLASLAALCLPFSAARAEQYREGPPPPVERHEDRVDRREAERPRMPPPRHEHRPPPPHREGYRWREGHWAWNGNRWIWISGRWYR